MICFTFSKIRFSSRISDAREQLEKTMLCVRTFPRVTGKRPETLLVVLGVIKNILETFHRHRKNVFSEAQILPEITTDLL